jgi:glutamate synthase domain-containing protein 2
MYRALATELRLILKTIGMNHVSELVGRTDTLRHLDHELD